jgi:hypothetical protein
MRFVPLAADVVLAIDDVNALVDVATDVVLAVDDVDALVDDLEALVDDEDAPVDDVDALVDGSVVAPVVAVFVPVAVLDPLPVSVPVAFEPLPPDMLADELDPPESSQMPLTQVRPVSHVACGPQKQATFPGWHSR